MLFARVTSEATFSLEVLDLHLDLTKCAVEKVDLHIQGFPKYFNWLKHLFTDLNYLKFSRMKNAVPRSHWPHH